MDSQPFWPIIKAAGCGDSLICKQAFTAGDGGMYHCI